MQNQSLSTSLLVALLLLANCGKPEPRVPEQGAEPPVSSSVAAPAASQSSEESALAAVRAVHGGTGPWAVAGYRMGRFALGYLGLPSGSFDLEVTHYAPREVQYSCIADGAAAATGASLGKLNLSLSETTRADTHTTYTNRATGKRVTLAVTPSFRERFLEVPRARLPEAGRAVLRLRDEQIFQVIPE
jgi:formylmethanofuran dehydrogenase subunit E